MRILNFHIFSRFARTQAYLHSCLEPTEFSLPQRYANTINTVGLAILYAPVLPLSPAIAFVGLLISYATDQYIALRKAHKPTVRPSI